MTDYYHPTRRAFAYWAGISDEDLSALPRRGRTIRWALWRLLYVAAALLVLYLAACLGTGVWNDGRIGAACTEYGYPEHRTNYNPLTLQFRGYCVKRVNQTDSVVALDSLRKGGGR